MALDFPSPASPGQIYSYGIYTWEYNGTYWKSISTNSFLPISGGTVTGSTSFTAGLLSSSISATTYENLPSFNFAQINGITQFSAGTNNYINFSGVNITITSAATNTLVLSAGTGGSGTISGTVNYIPKFTSSSSIGNSSITNIGNTVYVTGLTSVTDTALVVNKGGKGYVSEFRCIGSNTNLHAVAGFTDIGINQFGIYGEAKGYFGQHAVLGSNVGSGSTIIAIRGVAVNDVNSVSTVIGGQFQASTDTNVSSYSVQLSDGTEGLNKVLISKTSDGKANWSDSLTGLTLVSSETISATTYQNLPISAVTNGTGISATTSNGVSTISNTQIQGITGKTDGAGISSSISNNVITITNTGVTSLITGTGISGNSTTGAVTLQLSASSYSMFANNTASTSVPSEVAYKETGEADFSVTSTITWGSAPASAGNYRYRWQQIGNMVVFNFEWTSSAIGTLPITITLPSDMPSPAIPTGFNSALYVTHRYLCYFNNQVGGGGTTNTASFMSLRRNSGNTAYEFNNPGGTLVRWFNFNGHYFV